MAGIDDIFKRAGVSGKRKIDAVKDPNEIYKATRLNQGVSDTRGQDIVQTPSEVGLDDDDRDFGPELPLVQDGQDFGPELPLVQDGQDDDDQVADDEGGRFFGGGITKQESKMLDFVEGAGVAIDSPTMIDAAWLRKTALNLEKKISKNAELRAKYESDPQKFIGSEADLDADIKGLSVLSEHPDLYLDFVKQGCAANLVGLLAHDNTDIAIDTMEIIGELTDEDVAAEDQDWNILVDALIDADLVGLLVSNLSRLDEEDETDRNGVYYALGIVENLCSRPPMATRIGGQGSLLTWLLQRIRRKEQLVSQNKQYAAEILAILCQSSAENRRQLSAQDAVDTMLQLVAPYRKLDPDGGGDEEEYMENLFEALTCLVDDPAGKTAFVEAEGVELCLIMIRQGKMSKGPALRLLDHAAGGFAGTSVCMKLVDAGGLKNIFTLFNKTDDHRLVVPLLGILASMLRLLPADSAERIRTLAKFVEKDYEKTAKLIRLHIEYGIRVHRVEEEDEVSADTDVDETAVKQLSRKLDAGLFTLQQIDQILAWLVAEDSGARKQIRQMLAERGEDLSRIGTTLREQRDGLDMDEEDSRDLGDMLSTLLKHLQ